VSDDARARDVGGTHATDFLTPGHLPVALKTRANNIVQDDTADVSGALTFVGGD